MTEPDPTPGKHVPIPEGRSGDARMEADLGKEPVPQIKQRHDLQSMSKEYVFFHVGIWQAKIELNHDPVQEFVNRAPRLQYPPAFIDLDWSPVSGCLDSRGIGPWNRRILCAHRSYWPALRTALSSVGFVNRQKKTAWKSFYHRIKVIDRIAMRNLESLPDRLPYITVVVFSGSGNRGGYYLESDSEARGDAAKRVTTPLAVKTFTPSMTERVFATLVLRDEDPSPVMRSSVKAINLVWDQASKKYLNMAPAVDERDHEHRDAESRKTFSGPIATPDAGAGDSPGDILVGGSPGVGQGGVP